QKSLDHAQIVLFQWTNFNPSLTLYARNVVYDQDFFSKSSLTIDPRFVRGTKTYPVFAEPFVFTDSLTNDRFVIDSGVKVNITAKESIRIKPGFYAKKGSTCRIKIISEAEKE
ncbi:MAG: 3-coathanger stack domain-containing protein, partial [Bacteroidales bacterium]